jgi:hypothetical protein
MIPFNQLYPAKDSKNFAQQVVEYYIYMDFNTFLRKDLINTVIENKFDFNQNVDFEQPDLNTLKKYVLRQ